MTDLALHNEVERQVAELHQALKGCPEPHLTVALGNFRRVVWDLETLREKALATCETWREFVNG